jgi:hypothetical protein
LVKIGTVAALVLFLSATFSPAFGGLCPNGQVCLANCCSDQKYVDHLWDCDGLGTNCVNQNSSNCGCTEDPGLAGPG